MGIDLKAVAVAVMEYLKADWIILLIGILLAVSMTVYVNPEKVKLFFKKNEKVSVFSAVLLGALTPLCACGTMAIVLSMFASAMPWAPMMAFLVSSPLASPSEFLFEAAFLGWPFASGMIVVSVILGLSSGMLAALLERKTAYFEGQYRSFTKENNPQPPEGNTTQCCNSDKKTMVLCTDTASLELCTADCEMDWIERIKLKTFLETFWSLGIKKILFYFVVFIAISQLAEQMIPKQWILGLFGSETGFSIPLAATIGLPLYLNNASSMPLLKMFMDAGASPGALMAFLIAGKATGVPVITGLSVLIKPKALVFYILFVYLGAVGAGYAYQMVLQTGIL